MTTEEPTASPAREDECADLAASPIGFVEGVLGMPLYPWQDAALLPFTQATGPNAVRVKVSLATPNGAGKSERVVAGLALWWVALHRRGKVVITSRDGKQLSQQIVPAIDRHLPTLVGWRAVHSPRYLVRTPTGGTIQAFVTNEGSRFEGWHKEDDSDGPLLIIIDEAKSVPEGIFQGADRCTFNALLLCSSPGLMQGRFYDSHTRHRAQFTCVQAGLIDCPHIPRAKVADIIASYGENHPFTRSSVYGEFMEQDNAARFVVGLTALNRCLSNPPDPKPGVVAAFCDFAAGGDENVVAVRRGNRVTIPAAWREADKRAAVGRFITEFRRAELLPEQIWCDASDKDMADLLADAGWRVNRQNFGAPALNPEMYVSWGSEAWHETGPGHRALRGHPPGRRRHPPRAAHHSPQAHQFPWAALSGGQAHHARPQPPFPRPGRRRLRRAQLPRLLRPNASRATRPLRVARPPHAQQPRPHRLRRRVLTKLAHAKTRRREAEEEKGKKLCSRKCGPVFSLPNPAFLFLLFCFASSRLRVFA